MATTHSSKLEDQAATAALYVTKGKTAQPKKPSNYPLDKDNKLSSAGAATSLKYANPKDLPSYPILGLENTESSAGAAASLATANQKAFEHWKAGDIPAANKAATAAKDYKMDPLWQPEPSSAGSQAASIAQKDGGQVNIWRPQGTDAGHSAAGQAMRKKGLSPQLDYGHTAEGGRRALIAATGAMSGGRKRSDSTPVAPSTYPDSENSAANAMKAATSVSRSARREPAPVVPTEAPFNAGRVHSQAITNLSREMYTSHPPVAPEVEERNRQAGLRAAAVSMAKKMYDIQQRQIEEASAVGQSDSQYAAASVHNRPQSSTSSEDSHPVPQYANLQEAAKKLAGERLAKLHDEHAAYRTYYGTQAAPQSHKLSIRGRNRRRASSDGQAKESDEERSRQIREEMSLFTDKINKVDEKKRQKDRDSLLAAAQRNVRASMHAQDERVFNETGKVTPAMMADWESKAKAKAEADSEKRMVNHGMVNIGGGKFLDQSEVDAIAAKKVQPTLDEITDSAEKRRARDEELRQQQLERDQIAAEKVADDKERAAKTKEEWKRFKEEEKQDAKVKKEEEKTKKAEEKRLREEEKRRSKDEKARSKLGGQGLKEEPVVEPEPPVIAPIPHVASIAAESRLQSPQGNEDRIEVDSAFVSVSDREAEMAMNPPEERAMEPVVKSAEIEEVPTGHISNAEEIANRVLAAPIATEFKPTTHDDIAAAEAQDVADVSENKLGTVIAPTSQSIKNAISTYEPQGGSGSTFPDGVEKPSDDKSEAPVSAPTTETAPKISEPPTATPKHDTPIASRIVPTAVSGTTETSISGPTKPAKEKDQSKGVSSWLKTKFSRRLSKPAKPDPNVVPPPPNTTIPAPTASGSTPAPVTEKAPSNTDASIREVAMAGKPSPEPHPPTTTTTTMTSGAHPLHSSVSPSVSSLSSDEDIRGRSAIRLADQLQNPNNTTGAPVTVPVTANRNLDSALSKQSTTGTSGSRGDEFEEARDTFDSEMLAPPPAVVGGAAEQERKSDSPKRDSRFVEEL